MSDPMLDRTLDQILDRISDRLTDRMSHIGSDVRLEWSDCHAKETG